MALELKNEEKLAIRDYLRNMIMFPGIIVSVIMFLIGFFINDVAKKDAYFKANEVATNEIIKLTKETSKINSEVNFNVNESKRLLQEVNTLRQQLETASSVFRESLKVEENVAISLAKRPDFQEKVARAYRNEMEELLSRISSRIDQLVDDLGAKESIITQLNKKTKFIEVEDDKTIIAAGPNELVIQDDGNVVVYKKVTGRRFSPNDGLWDSKTEKR